MSQLSFSEAEFTGRCKTAFVNNDVRFLMPRDSIFEALHYVLEATLLRDFKDRHRHGSRSPPYQTIFSSLQPAITNVTKHRRYKDLSVIEYQILLKKIISLSNLLLESHTCDSLIARHGHAVQYHTKTLHSYLRRR